MVEGVGRAIARHVELEGALSAVNNPQDEGIRLGLPEQQGAAIRAAFGLSDETVAERFRISLAAPGLLAAAAEEQPFVCAVDDAQSLDDASAAALDPVAELRWL